MHSLVVMEHNIVYYATRPNAAKSIARSNVVYSQLELLIRRRKKKDFGSEEFSSFLQQSSDIIEFSETFDEAHLYATKEFADQYVILGIRLNQQQLAEMLYTQDGRVEGYKHSMYVSELDSVFFSGGISDKDRYEFEMAMVDEHDPIFHPTPARFP